MLENHSDYPVQIAKDVGIAQLSPVPDNLIGEDDDPADSSVADMQPFVLSPERAEIIRTYVESRNHLAVPEQGRSSRSGWSGQSRTTFSPDHDHHSKTMPKVPRMQDFAH